jgi:hypothetical protein
VNIVPEKAPDFTKSISPDRRHIQAEKWRDQVLQETEEFLRESRHLRDLERLKSKGSTRTGRINPLASTKRLFKTDRNTRKTDRNHSTSGMVLEKYSKLKGLSLRKLSDWKQQEGVWVVLGHQTGKGVIESRIADDLLS